MRMGDERWPRPESQSEVARLYGNPYYSYVRPGRRTLLFNEWAIIGFNKGFASYPSFVDAKSGYIIVSERDNHRLQIFDNVGAPSRFDRSFHLPSYFSSTDHNSVPHYRPLQNSASASYTF